MSKNEEWKAVVTEKDNNTFELTEALAEHVYYDGDSIPCNQTVRHYSRSGKLIESVELKDVLKIGRKHLVMMAGIIIIKYR